MLYPEPAPRSRHVWLELAHTWEQARELIAESRELVRRADEQTATAAAALIPYQTWDGSCIVISNDISKVP